MSNLLILNQSKYYSDWASFFYLGPDSRVDVRTCDADDKAGCYILGGPVLTKDELGLTDTALRLTSCLDAGFYFFPKSSQDMIVPWCKEIEIKSQIPALSLILIWDTNTETNTLTDIVSQSVAISCCLIWHRNRR